MSYDPMSEAMLAMAIGMNTGSASEGLETVQNAEQDRARSSCQLPRKMYPSKEVFEAFGFTFKDIDDPILYQASLPEGWLLKKENGYWTNLIDEKGRKRGNFFYKGAFYDRNGSMKLFQRFSIKEEATIPEKWEGPYIISVKDSDGNTIFTAGKCDKLFSDEYNKLIDQAKEFLHTNYPNWEDPTKYWN